MTSKLKLKQDATFKAVVNVPVTGGEPVAVEFVFKNRTRQELDKFYLLLGEAGGVDEVSLEKDTDLMMTVIGGWDIDAEFNRDNVAAVLNNYPRLGVAVVNAYLEAFKAARLGN